jgi:hypothetical protein
VFQCSGAFTVTISNRNDEVITLTTSGIVNDDLLARLKTLPKLRELDIIATRRTRAASHSFKLPADFA